MALSQKTTPVAILRGILGPIHGQEKRFAKLVGKSVSWVKKVSAGIMPLSEDTARVLEFETGISLAWLMDGNARKLPLNFKGTPYTSIDFEAHRAALDAGNFRRICISTPVKILPTIVAIGSAAGKNGKASLFHWRLTNLLNECREEFGFDKVAEDRTEEAIYNSNLPSITFHDTIKSQHTNETRSSFGISRKRESEPIRETKINPPIVIRNRDHPK